jgi:hypothetical protein
MSLMKMVSSLCVNLTCVFCYVALLMWFWAGGGVVRKTLGRGME